MILNNFEGYLDVCSWLHCVEISQLVTVTLNFGCQRVTVVNTLVDVVGAAPLMLLRILSSFSNLLICGLLVDSSGSEGSDTIVQVTGL